MTLPDIDPVAFQIGPLVIRWYALAYIAGLLLGWLYMRKLAANARLWGALRRPTSEDLDDLLVFAALGVVVGGRLGFVLFYRPEFYFANPLEILQTWKGGMSFHGGLFGAWLAVFLFARRRGLDAFAMSDMAAVVAPLGLLFGRLANFIKGELWGRPTDVPWAFVFPDAGPELRHPSQLYEAGLEGLLLLIVLGVLVRRIGFARPGLLAGVFGMGYAVARFSVEFFREPDRYLGFIAGGWLTMGMALSIPMFGAALWLALRALRSGPQTLRPENAA
ncbi:MAG: phosphatidylglycerolprolipoprotein diacylglycerol [Beijerinckiaceae bacterium]|nr:MAG: phosphatidylglycerolprolipoprotein diacylglycerol [Beijerinckiaceae bacterium]